MFNKKILVLGNNDVDTDVRTSALATENGTQNHGLITDPLFTPSVAGYYHTTVLDINRGSILEISKSFDTVVMLDQPSSSWSNWKPLLATYKLMVEFEEQGKDVVYRDNENVQKLEYWKNTIRDKKGFCIYPWVLLTNEHGHTSVCLRTNKKVTDVESIGDWQTDPEYTKVREAMLTGDRIDPDHCKYCYELEDLGVESPRMFETMDWVAKLDVDGVEGLKDIKNPMFYEVRLDNRCNLACRHCQPNYSSLIEKEYTQLKIIYPKDLIYTFSTFDHVRVDAITDQTRIHVTGGEVTVMPEFQEFLHDCIKHNRTNFDFCVGSNGYKISSKIFDLCDNFSNMTWSISLDGFGPVNDYLRWPSKFESIMDNVRELRRRGHIISWNMVPSLYNVTNLHLLFEYWDQEFPDINIYTQINHYGDGIQSAYNHPNHELAVHSLERITKTSVYHADGRATKSTIDALLAHYQTKPKFDPNALKKFFDLNDQLDVSRKMYLKDYIPELEECRKFTTHLA